METNKKINKTENIKEYRKNYNILNKQKYYNTLYPCDICGGKYTLTNKSHHIKSKKHISQLNLIELNNAKNELMNIKNNLKILSN